MENSRISSELVDMDMIPVIVTPSVSDNIVSAESVPSYYSEETIAAHPLLGSVPEAVYYGHSDYPVQAADDVGGTVVMEQDQQIMQQHVNVCYAVKRSLAPNDSSGDPQQYRAHFTSLFEERDKTGDVTLMCSANPGKDDKPASPTPARSACQEEPGLDYVPLKAHNFVLKKSSAFFRRCFESTELVDLGQQCPGMIIFLPTISVDTMSHILKLFYTSEIRVLFEEMLPFWAAADQLQIRKVDKHHHWLYHISTRRPLAPVAINMTGAVGEGSPVASMNSKVFSNFGGHKENLSQGEQQGVIKDGTTICNEAIGLSTNTLAVIPIVRIETATRKLSTEQLQNLDDIKAERNNPGASSDTCIITQDSLKSSNTPSQENASITTCSSPSPGINGKDSKGTRCSSPSPIPPSPPLPPPPPVGFPCTRCPTVLSTRKSLQGHLYRHKIKEKRAKNNKTVSKNKKACPPTTSSNINSDAQKPSSTTPCPPASNAVVSGCKKYRRSSVIITTACTSTSSEESSTVSSECPPSTTTN